MAAAGEQASTGADGRAREVAAEAERVSGAGEVAHRQAAVEVDGGERAHIGRERGGRELRGPHRKPPAERLRATRVPEPDSRIAPGGCEKPVHAERDISCRPRVADQCLEGPRGASVPEADAVARPGEDPSVPAEGKRVCRRRTTPERPSDLSPPTEIPEPDGGPVTGGSAISSVASLVASGLKATS